MGAETASDGARGLPAGDVPAMIGKYRIEKLIGRGAMGIVYKGHDDQIDRPLAIKTLRLDVIANIDDHAGMLKRFASEARAAGRCLHPNIVTVFDYVEQDGAPYLVMEYVEAGTLENVIKNAPLMPIRQVGEIMAQLLLALGHAHAKGIVHRDIKPANILCPSATSIKVGDFGVARFESMSQTILPGSSVIGTPNYMAPEQFLGRRADARADLFAASVIMFQLLTKARPFVAKDVPELMHKLLNEVPLQIGALRAGNWSGIDAVLQRGLARNPEDRFQNADSFIDALNNAIETVDIDVSPPLDLTKVSVAPPLERPSNPGSTERDLGRTMADKLMPRTLGAIEQSLARSIGPIAKVVMARATKSATDPDKLLTLLAAQFADAKEATLFRQNAEVLLRSDDSLTAIQLGAAVPPADILAATKALLPLIGPMAKILAERGAKTAMGREDYFKRLADAIPNEKDRKLFLASKLGTAPGGKT
jgi:eukaryotic-like serine/threonine-protein kinase